MPRPSFLSGFLGLHPLPSPMRSLYRAAAGEVAVADALAQLGGDWLVLHAVPVGKDGTDVDHIAVGPPGVYTISVRHH
ncbi:MAG TPA: nuclease-related domain-containing protein, partial [Terrimesophilobacter sp.]|nr:nuclease-related domain-containing protein [Terrimesophilobacter sp.]